LEVLKQGSKEEDASHRAFNLASIDGP
jgi:hypothetical protein